MSKPSAHALRTTAGQVVLVAQVLVYLLGLCAVLGGGGVALMTREPDGFGSPAEHPYVAAGVGLAIVWLTVAAALRAGLQFLAWRVQADVERDTPAPGVPLHPVFASP